MTQREFSQILETLPSLTHEQLELLRRRIDSQAAAKPVAPQADDEETVFDVASRAGLIGCIKGKPGSPTDLSTNPVHMEGFGRG